MRVDSKDNPPYVEYSKVKRDYKILEYQTQNSGNLYAFVMERSINLISSSGRLGMIVPLSLVATERVNPLQSLLLKNNRANWFSLYDVYPSKIFEGAKQRLTICIVSGEQQQLQIYSTKYNRWKPEERTNLLNNLAYWPSYYDQKNSVFPKLQDKLNESLLKKLSQKESAIYVSDTQNPSFYVHRIPYNYIKAFNFIPYFWNEIDGEKKSEDYKPYTL